MIVEQNIVAGQNMRKKAQKNLCSAFVYCKIKNYEYPKNLSGPFFHYLFRPAGKSGNGAVLD